MVIEALDFVYWLRVFRGQALLDAGAERPIGRAG